jgi:hypothetical protein
MELSAPCISTGLIIIGIAFLFFGILVRSGRHKRWYLHKGDPLYNPKEFALVCIPFGLMMLLFGIALVLPTPEARQAIFWWGAFPLGIAGAVLLFWPPDWIKPAWLRWLEKNNEDIVLLILLEDARETPDWERRVATQAGLEAWVAEVRRKHGLEEH